VGALAFSRSRGGMILAIAALAGIAAIVLTQPAAHRGKAHRTTRWATIAVLSFAALFTAVFGLGRMLTRFDPGQGPDARGALAQTTFEMALKALPFGTGLGTFVPVYATIEKTGDLSATYANRAHNDLLELFMETGILGAGLLLAFLFWFARRALAVWRRQEGGSSPAQAMLEKSATLVIALLLAHSLADYPLRTGALSAIFAFFCAILAAPAAAPQVSDPSRKRHAAPPPLDLRLADAAAPAENWGSQVQWPDKWKR
jgi:O-antigen ligase